MTKINDKLLIIIVALYLFYNGCKRPDSDNQQRSDKVMIEDYYENGQLMSKVWYKDGKKDSLGIWYYENGNVEIIARFSLGNQEGPTIHYYENGKPKIYYYYNNGGDGSLMYSREYNETGELIQEKGQRLGVMFEKSDTVKQGKYFGFTAVVVKPPGTTMTVYTFTKDESPEFKVRSTYQVKDKIPYFKHYFENIGHQPMKVVSELNDTIRNEIHRDTFSFIVTVE